MKIALIFDHWSIFIKYNLFLFESCFNALFVYIITNIMVKTKYLYIFLIIVNNINKCHL